MSRFSKACVIGGFGWALGLTPVGCGTDERPVAPSGPAAEVSDLAANDLFSADCDAGADDDGGDHDNGRAAARDDGKHNMRRRRIRLLAPLSGSIDDSLRPELKWVVDNRNADGDCRDRRGAHRGSHKNAERDRVTVEICRDRPCNDVVATFVGHGGTARPPAPLPAGTLFWRVVAGHHATETWEITIPHRESGRPIFFAAVPDYNGDGLADVALGAPGPSDGSVPIFYGSNSLPGLTPDVTLSGEAGFGCGVAAVGDTNGDGFSDLAVATGCSDGTVTIYNGSPAGPMKGRTLQAGPVTAGFGTRMASAGDVNGDGYGDVIVGGLEAAQVFLGGPDGVSTRPFLSLPPQGGGATTVQGPGDVNGDGLPDVSVAVDIFPGAIFLGTGGGFAKLDVALRIGGGNSFAGDANGDGFGDFDSFVLLAGTPTGVDTQNALVDQPAMPLYLAAGDIDADGFGDQIQLVGSVTNQPEHYRIVFGQPTACNGVGCPRFVPLFPPGLTPFDFAILAGVGDVNGDHADDLVVARPSIGTVYLYLGGSGFPGSPARTWTGPVGFGASVPALFGTATFFGQP